MNNYLYYIYTYGYYIKLNDPTSKAESFNDLYSNGQRNGQRNGLPANHVFSNLVNEIELAVGQKLTGKKYFDLPNYEWIGHSLHINAKGILIREWHIHMHDLSEIANNAHDFYLKTVEGKRTCA